MIVDNLFSKTKSYRKLRLVSRKSALAMWQAEFVKTKLESIHSNLVVTIIGITTQGDKILETSLAKMGGKGLFVKELEECLLKGEADIAVHSMKDLPAILPEGLRIGAILEREDPRDALVSKHFKTIQDLPKSAIIGTSSLRRQAQIYCLRSNLQVETLRGNVDTRVQKLEDGKYDAILLAVAGLVRLGLRAKICEYLEPEVMLPGVGQGALGIEYYIGNKEVQALIEPLHHRATGFCLAAERSMNLWLGGSCQVPVAGLGVIKGDGNLELKGMVGSPDGRTILRSSATGEPEDAKNLGECVAKELLAQGAKAIIDACSC